MITKALLASVLLVAGSYGASELVDEIKPLAETVVVSTTLESALRNAQYLETLGLGSEEALERVVYETPDAEGLEIVDGKLRYQVLDTCAVAYFGDQYEKIVQPC